MRPVNAEPSGADRAEWVDRPGGALDAYLRDHQRAENFPVALRVLPRGPRTHLAAVYDVARVIDDLGDDAPGDRTALLTGFREDLLKIWSGARPDAPVLRRLAPTVAACAMPPEPFCDLVAANLLDQRKGSYQTYRDLEGYCALSANPIGRIVLYVFGAATPERLELSDRVCTALQVIEHCQDVAEDYRADRCYLPQDDLDRAGVDPDAFTRAPASAELREVVALQASRAAAGLDDGLALVAGLRGWARIAVAGYLAGGRAALIALRRAKWDVMSSTPAAQRLDVVKQIMGVLAGRRVAG